MGQNMQRPIELRFRSPHRSSKISQNFLKKVRYKVSYGDKELIRFKEGSCYSQRYSHYLFYIELMEVRLAESLDMSYLIKDPALFLFFMLEGNVSFSMADGTPISNAKKGICYPTYNKTGEFFVHFPAGVHRLLYISTRPGWLKNHLQTYPHFAEFMLGFEQKTNMYEHMFQFPITRGMRGFLRELYKIDPVSARKLEVGITDNCMGLFEEYHQMLLSGNKSLSLLDAVVQLKAHLDGHFTERDADILSKLLEEIPFTERTVRHAFHEQLKYTVHEYIELLRVNYGHELLQKTKLSVKEIGLKTGFKSHAHFTFVYKKHYNSSPRSDR
ncbi:Helix-turn-helix domain-containing protein [Pedobacter westerhofensis]|uniref:Helix-turn-helix domain-containing protein n=1 Tax=Pedobacter westerhofensis TaxID=425512 RepID=A0A521EEU3_9SPHI|nr:helix-turn-helix transcriptional regulator [Pedobacter westerhofensis]SMO82405.1 Helix-turn-helix domain-containing protein [Pedobacter westerhofensis]